MAEAVGPSVTPGRLVLVRHGATAWSQTGRHTGRSDVELTEAGRRSAEALAARLAGWSFASVRCSPLRRAAETARLAGLVVDVWDEDLVEWDYGGWEGMTTPEIRAATGDPAWTVWDEGVPPAGDTPGETLVDVGRRVDRVIAAVREVVRDGRDVALVAHAHLLRVLTARWLGLPPDAGRSFRLETAGTGTLGYERETPVLVGWDGGLSVQLGTR